MSLQSALDQAPAATTAPLPSYAGRGAVPTPALPTRYVEHVMGMPLSLALRGRHRQDHHARARLGGGHG